MTHLSLALENLLLIFLLALTSRLAMISAQVHQSELSVSTTARLPRDRLLPSVCTISQRRERNLPEGRGRGEGFGEQRRKRRGAGVQLLLYYIADLCRDALVPVVEH